MWNQPDSTDTFLSSEGSCRYFQALKASTTGELKAGKRLVSAVPLDMSVI